MRYAAEMKVSPWPSGRKGGAVVVILGLGAGCAGVPAGYLGTDLPEPPGLTHVRAQNVRLVGSDMVQGELVYHGRRADVVALAVEYARRLSAAGWEAEQLAYAASGAEMVFVKDWRQVRVMVRAGEGVQATVTVSERGDSGSSSEALP